MGRDVKKTLAQQLVELLTLLLIVALIPIWLPILIGIVGLIIVYYFVLNLYAWLMWLPKGKQVLFVYSNSPIWQNYISTNIIPEIAHCSVVLNWSERKQWSKYAFPTLAFQLLGGGRAFNPLAIVFRPMKTAKIIRFWEAFKSYKHGNSLPLKQAETELFNALKIETA